MRTSIQATDYYGYLLVRAYCGLLIVTMVTYCLGPIMVYCLLLWLLIGQGLLWFITCYYGYLPIIAVTALQKEHA
jgi:hypothetical protein